MRVANNIRAATRSRRQVSLRNMTSLAAIEKTHTFTTHLPADPAVPTPQHAHDNPSLTRTPRTVRGALFTYVMPTRHESYEVLAWSDACLETLGLNNDEKNNAAMQALVAGADQDIAREHHPYAQCYGGYQFGTWASQLGDGRVINLCELTNPESRERYELQLKGAGMTPYSRFADGKAVLRSSIREFLISEHLHALGVPSTRALALTLLPESQALRERVEPCAIVARCAPSWIRFGTFDLLRRRGDRRTTKVLADYTIEHVFGGRDRLQDNLKPRDNRNVYTQLYRQIAHRSALLVARMQAYGFLNGVLNTDNTSVLGLALDFGPFSCLDTFDASYTPNHDDHQNRYSYQMQPSVFWWNCLRLGEALGELMGSGDAAEEVFARTDFLAHEEPAELIDPVLTAAEEIILECTQDFKDAFREEYAHAMSKRLGVTLVDDGDLGLVSRMLDTMQTYELDFPCFFIGLCDPRATGQTITKAMNGNFGGHGREEAEKAVDGWLVEYSAKLDAAGVVRDDEWHRRMLGANPRFVLRSWILAEVIDRVEKGGEREILRQVLDAAVRPYDDYTGTDFERFCTPPVPSKADMQCSCSS